MSSFVTIGDKHAPLRNYRVKANSQPWVSHDIVVLMKERNLLHKLAVQSKDAIVYEMYKKTRNTITRLIRDAKRRYFHERITYCARNNKN